MNREKLSVYSVDKYQNQNRSNSISINKISKQGKFPDLNNPMSLAKTKFPTSLSRKYSQIQRRKFESQPKKQIPKQPIQSELNKIRRSQNLCLKIKINKSTDLKNVRKSIQILSKIDRIDNNFISKTKFKDEYLFKNVKNSLSQQKPVNRHDNKQFRNEIYSKRNLMQKHRTNIKVVTESVNDQIKQIPKNSKHKVNTEMKSAFQQQKIEQIQLKQCQSQQKLQIQHFLLIEDILLNIHKNINNNTSVQQLCLCYINMDKIKNQRCFYKLLDEQNQISPIRMLFLLQRIAIFIVIYIEREKSKRKRFQNALSDLTIIIFKNRSVMIQLTLQLLFLKKILDVKMIKPKELDKQKKLREIMKANNSLKMLIIKILQKKQLPMLQLIANLLESGIKIQSIQYVNIIQKTLKWQLLRLPSYPFLPPAIKNFSLILDLDQTLVHFNSKEGVFYVRPYCQEFLIKMSRLFEVTIFTAGTKQYADQIIQQIDPKKNVAFRLYRNHITIEQGIPVKDLSKLGRDLNKIIIIDNVASNFRLQNQNGILISSWYGAEDDQALQILSNVLTNIVTNNKDDLRQGVKQWNDFLKQQISQNRLIYQLNKQL